VRLEGELRGTQVVLLAEEAGAVVRLRHHLDHVAVGVDVADDGQFAVTAHQVAVHEVTVAIVAAGVAVFAVQRGVLVDQHPRRYPRGVESVEEVLDVVGHLPGKPFAVVADLEVVDGLGHHRHDVAVPRADAPEVAHEGLLHIVVFGILLHVGEDLGEALRVQLVDEPHARRLLELGGQEMQLSPDVGDAHRNLFAEEQERTLGVLSPSETDEVADCDRRWLERCVPL